jgi:hypothetical protein
VCYTNCDEAELFLNGNRISTPLFEDVVITID